MRLTPHTLAPLATLLLWSGVVYGQDKAPEAKAPEAKAAPPRTLPHDLLYGDRETTQYGKLPEGAGELAPVDRRDDVDRMASLGVLLPTAHVPVAGTLQYTNHLLAGHQLSWSPSDTLALSAMLVLPPALIGSSPLKAEVGWGLSATWQVWRGRDVSLAVMPFVLGRHGQLELDTSEIGAGAALLADWAVHDRVVVGAGVIGYAPLRMGYDQYDTSGCDSRDDFINQRCLAITNRVAWGPPGGRFLLGWLHTAIYAPHNVNVKLEVVTGASSGTVLDLEGLVWGADSADVQRRRYASRGWAAGPLHRSRVTAHVGMGWTPGAWGAQVGLLLVPGRFGKLGLADAEDEAKVLPMMQIGYRF
jgi:hypothetical protein